MSTILDLHIHSVFSVDSPVQPEEYLEHLLALRKSFHIDGLAFCEHRRFVAEFDYHSLAQKYGVVVLAGVEAETRWGHLLVFCPDQKWMSHIGFEQKFDPIELAKEVEAHQGIVIPAHPFRGMFAMGMGERVSELPHLYAIETINGGNRPEENQNAIELAERLGVAQVGGSDAHFLDELGLAMTEFEKDVRSVQAMIQEIKAGRVRALSRNKTSFYAPQI